jgi:hypothetical protein
MTRWGELKCPECAVLEAKLVKKEAVKEAQQLMNYYAVEVLTYGATVARLQNLESAWVNLQTQSELAELSGGSQKLNEIEKGQGECYDPD